MKKLFLSLLSLSLLGFAVQAQSTWPEDQQSRTEQSAEMRDRAMQPETDVNPNDWRVVDEGLPEMDLPGMRTVDVSGEQTAPLQEGFTQSYEGNVQATGLRPSDAGNESMRGERDPETGRWIDRDNDGYDPVVDEIEQGAETAVKATGEALETAGEAIKNTYDKVTGDDEEPEDQD